jgi:hypothetical protein
MTEKEIAAKREEIEKTKIQIAKAEFIHNLDKLNVQFAENPHLFDEVSQYLFERWNEETYRIVMTVREAKEVAENSGEQSKKTPPYQSALQTIYDRKPTYIKDEV